MLVISADEGLSVGDIQQRMKMPASTLAFHLRALVNVDLVRQEKRGRTVICRPVISNVEAALAFIRDECCIGFA